MRTIVISVALVIACLSFVAPAHAQRGSSKKDQIALVEQALRGTAESNNVANDPRAWIACSRGGNVSLIGWRTQKTDKPDTYLVSYTFKQGKDNVEMGWWWEIDMNAKKVRAVVYNEELQNRYHIGASNLVDVLPTEGMTKLTVKTVLGEPDRVDEDSFGDAWYYSYQTPDDRTLVKKLQFASIDETLYIISEQQTDTKKKEPYENR